METCTTLKVISWTKKTLHFGLFIAFLVLSSFALQDLLSGDKIIQLNKVNQEFITNFPSFTLCPYQFINKTQLYNGELSKNILPFQAKISAGFKYKSSRKWVDVDLLNQTEMKNHLDGQWDLNCRSLVIKQTPDCMPCLTFRYNSLRSQDIQKAKVRFYMKQTSVEELGVLFTIHAKNQALLLRDSVDLSRTYSRDYSHGKK